RARAQVACPATSWSQAPSRQVQGKSAARGEPPCNRSRGLASTRQTVLSPPADIRRPGGEAEGNRPKFGKSVVRVARAPRHVTFNGPWRTRPSEGLARVFLRRAKMNKFPSRVSAARRNAEAVLSKTQKRESTLKIEQERERDAMVEKTARLRE